MNPYITSGLQKSFKTFQQCETGKMLKDMERKLLRIISIWDLHKVTEAFIQAERKKESVGLLTYWVEAYGFSPIVFVSHSRCKGWGSPLVWLVLPPGLPDHFVPHPLDHRCVESGNQNNHKNIIERTKRSYCSSHRSGRILGENDMMFTIHMRSLGHG